MTEHNHGSGSENGVLQFTPAEYEYNTLMHLLGVSVSKHLLDEHFTLIWANEFYYELIGWPKDEYEAVFHNRPDLYYRDEPEEWQKLSDTVLQALAAGQEGYRLLSRIRRKNGDYVWVQFSARFADEYIDGCQVAYSALTNVDDLVKMQREQSVTYESLPGFVAKYRIEKLDSGMELTLLSANRRFMEYFGGNNNRAADSLYNRNVQENMEMIERQKSRIRAGEPLHFTMHVKSRDGQALWLQVNATCVDWQEGCPVYLVIFIDITDVTELREMQRKLIAQTEALKDAMTTIAAAYIEDRKRVEDCLEKIGYSSKHLMTLINDVLDMSKIDAGKMQISHETFSLERTLESITSMVYPQAADKGLTFTVPPVDLSDTVLTGDELRLNQILINLLSNAVKFTPEGGTIRLEIRQLWRRPGRVRLRFTVSDTGVGMSEAFLGHIFDPFEQEDGRRAGGGTGLGMPITRNLVTLMGGTISVKSRPDQGSTFTVELDFDLPDRENAAPEQKLHAIQSLKVLVADDDRDSCIHASLLLQNLGIDSDWVQTGRECVEKVRAAHRSGTDYDVCLVDWRMPDMDGIEATRRMREAVGPDTLIIIITAYDWGAIEQSARAAGANAFLSKPIFASTLYNALLAVTGIEKAVLCPNPGGSIRRPQLAGRHVLLVEDNEINREIAMELLKMVEITVDYAGDGQEAVDKFLAFGDNYDLILMDVQMPVMDGYRATQAIRRSGHPRAGSIPIIAMTADAFHEDVVRATEAGMDGHLAKPIDPERLYQMLAERFAEDK